MAETSNSNKDISIDQKLHQAFLKAVDTITTSVKEVVKAIDDQTKKEKAAKANAHSDFTETQTHKVASGLEFLAKEIEDQAKEEREAKTRGCRDSIEIQSHKVALGYEHTSIRITPKNKKYKNDPRFQQVDEQGRHYTTIGAGPKYDKLVSDLDRPKDIGPHPDRSPIGFVDCKIEAEAIEALLAKHEKYKHNLDYDLFSQEYEKQSWYWADDGYNSNSYIAGLIHATHLNRPFIPVSTHPGWNHPVPDHYFRDNESMEPSGKEILEKMIFKEALEKERHEYRETILEEKRLRRKEYEKEMMEKVEILQHRNLGGKEMCVEPIMSKPLDISPIFNGPGEVLNISLPPEQNRLDDAFKTIDNLKNPTQEQVQESFKIRN
jgi:hypothetical protein